jgi:lipoyl(octanoyl) transferase
MKAQKACGFKEIFESTDMENTKYKSIKNGSEFLEFHNIGLNDYQKTWNFQEELFNQVLKQKENISAPLTHHLIFCQHPHVYTLGKSGDEQNMLLNYIQLQAKNASFYKTNRGGDITYHGPGQLVGYPILSLSNLSIGLKEYIFLLEETIIGALAHYNLKGERLEGATGVWLDVTSRKNTRKICAIGVRSSHWVTMHGFALNINTDLSYFGHINPCGFTDKAVTSIEKEIGKKSDFEEVSSVVLKEFLKTFQFDLQ